MADYHQLLVRALTGLGKNPDEAWRAAIYARARGALVIELCGVTPPLSDAEITSECLLFRGSDPQGRSRFDAPTAVRNWSFDTVAAGHAVPPAEVRPGWVTNAASVGEVTGGP